MCVACMFVFLWQLLLFLCVVGFSGGGSLGSSAGKEEVVSWPISLKDSQARSSRISHIERYTYRVFNLDRNTCVYFVFRDRKQC